MPLLTKLKSAYLRCGAAIYQHATALEARLKGFELKPLPSESLQLPAFVGGPVDAPVMLMVHGYTADKNVWVRFGQHFLKDYRVIIPDLAGHGDAPYRADWSYSPAAQAQRLADLLRGLGAAQAHIIGNSMGGMIAAQFALQHPELTASLALIDPAGMDGNTQSEFDRQRDGGRNMFLVESPADFNEFYPLTMAKPPFLPPIVLAAVAERYRLRRDRHALIFAHFFEQKFSPQQLASITAPVWLLWGAKDRIVDVSAAAEWHSSIGHSSLDVLNDIGHMPMVEAPKLTAKMYRRFLRRSANSGAT